MSALVDREARERAAGDLDTTFLVEAGAGTGKTTLLVERIAALVRAGVPMAEIVAITFTEKAAAELRVRVRNRLDELVAAGGEQAAAYRRALADLELARISTIHAFAGDLLRARPIEAGVDPAFAVADQLREQAAFDRAWERWLDRALATPALQDAFAAGLTTKQLETFARRLVENRDLLRPAPALALPDVEAFVGRLTREVDELLAVGRGACLDRDDAMWKALHDLRRTLAFYARLDPPERVRLVIGNLKINKTAGNQKHWQAGTLKTIKARLAELSDDLARLRTVYGHAVAAELLGALRGFVDAYEEAKRREGLLDFQDLLLRARDLVRDHLDVRAAFQRQFRRILVDEFQDTDPLQAELVALLADRSGTREWEHADLEPGRLFVVGDPKQSIYGWRRADIEIYEKVKELVGRRGRVLPIVTNFRSGPRIIEAVNRAYEQHIVPPEDGERYQPRYVPLVPRPDAAEDGPGVVLLYPPPGVELRAAMDAVRRAEAESVAAYVRRLVEGGGGIDGVRYRDVAILFRATHHQDKYEEALRAAGVPYVVAGGRRYHGKEEVGWLTAVLAAADDPGDRLHLVAALRSPFLGASDAEIARFAAAGGALDYRVEPPEGFPAIADAFQILREAHEARAAASVASVVEHLFDRTQALALHGLLHQGDQRVANLAKAKDLARALEAQGTLTLRGFVRWLRERGAEGAEEPEAAVAEEDDDAVKLLTMHKAKGLDWPVVIVAECTRGRERAADGLLVDRRENQVAVRVGKLGEACQVATDNFEAVVARRRPRDEAEAVRLGYVAMTRPKRLLVLPIFPHIRKDDFEYEGQARYVAHLLPPLDAPPYGEHNGWAHVFDTRTLERPAEAASPFRIEVGDGGADPVAEWQARRARLFERGLAAEEMVAPSDLVEHEEAEPSDAAMRFGTVVHRVLAEVPPDRADLVEPYVAAAAARAGLGAEEAARAREYVTRALALPTVRAARRAWREVPVVAEVDGVIVYGAIDLLAETDEGLVVLDYKTDPVPRGGPAVLAERYAPQLRAYARAVEKATGRKVGRVVVGVVGAGVEVQVTDELAQRSEVTSRPR